METKKYSSYAQIDLELEMLKLERELNLKRIVLNVQSTKEIFKPINLIRECISDYKSVFSNYSSTIINIALPILINWILKRKRGN